MSRLAAGAANRPFTGHVIDLPKGAPYARSNDHFTLLAVAPAVLLGLLIGFMLGGCSDIYFDRRDYHLARGRRCGGDQQGHA